MFLAKQCGHHFSIQYAARARAACAIHTAPRPPMVPQGMGPHPSMTGNLSSKTMIFWTPPRVPPPLRNSEKLQKTPKNYKNLQKTGWNHSNINELKIISANDSRAFATIDFSRIDKDGKEILRSKTMYTIAKKNDKWGLVLIASLTPFVKGTEQSIKLVVENK